MTSRPATWSPRRLGFAALAWAALTAIELAVVTTSYGNGWAPVGRLVPLYAALAVLWTVLTPTIAAWERARGPRSAVASVAITVTGIAVAGALAAPARRLVVTLVAGAAPLPFWATWLYYLDVTTAQYCAVLLAARVLDAHDALVARTRAELTLRAQLARARLAHLEAQLQPHFLFNALGAVTELAHEAPAAAARMLRQLAALLRSALERRGEEVTLGDELATLEPYLEIQRMRFADWLRIEQRVSPAARGVLVPRLVLQPLVENAIKHGLVGRSEAGRIEIAARVEDGRLHVAVRDNGIGLGAPDHTPGYGLGLRNVRERLATLYDDDWRLALDAAPGGGVSAELSIPARRTPREEFAEPSAPASHGAGRLLELVRRWPATATVLGWFLWGSAWVGQSRLYLVLRGRLDEAALDRQIVTHFVGAALWALATPLVVWLARRIPVQRRGAAWRVAAHLVLASALAFVHALVWRTILAVALAEAQPRWPAYFTPIVISVLTYLILVGVGHYGRAMQWLREREITAAALRAELDESALRSATARAQPEAIVRTLERLADEVTHDPAGTEQALAELADGLRESLAAGGRHAIRPDAVDVLSAHAGIDAPAWSLHGRPRVSPG